MSQDFVSELQNERERLAGKFFDSLVKLPEGKGVVVVRFLSNKDLPVRNGGLFTKSRLHYINSKGLHCPRELTSTKNGEFWVGPCPICEYYSTLWGDIRKIGGPNGEGAEAESLKTKARSIRPVERYYYNCIVRQQANEETGEMEYNVGPKILAVGKTLHEMIIRGITGSKDSGKKGYGDITNPVSGRDFRLVKTLKGTGKDAYPEYVQSEFVDVSPLGDPDQVEAWLSKLNDLEGLRVLKSYDELAHQLRVHFGVEKDTETGFVLEPAAETHLSESPKVEVTKTVAEKVTVPAGESLADDEFLKELNGI